MTTKKDPDPSSRDISFELLEECKQKAEAQLMYLAAQESCPRTYHNGLYAERKSAYQSYFESYGASGAALTTMARTLALFECECKEGLGWCRS